MLQHKGEVLRFNADHTYMPEISLQSDQKLERLVVLLNKGDINFLISPHNFGWQITSLIDGYFSKRDKDDLNVWLRVCKEEVSPLHDSKIIHSPSLYSVNMGAKIVASRKFYTTYKSYQGTIPYELGKLIGLKVTTNKNYLNK